MNTRLTFVPTALATTRSARAGFSPITAARTPTLPTIRRSAVTGAPIFRAPPLDLAARPTGENRFPAWHRGPLDRLQPPLTRFRD